MQAVTKYMRTGGKTQSSRLKHGLCMTFSSAYSVAGAISPVSDRRYSAKRLSWRRTCKERLGPFGHAVAPLYERRGADNDLGMPLLTSARLSHSLRECRRVAGLKRSFWTTAQPNTRENSDCPAGSLQAFRNLFRLKEESCDDFGELSQRR